MSGHDPDFLERLNRGLAAMPSDLRKSIVERHQQKIKRLRDAGSNNREIEAQLGSVEEIVALFTLEEGKGNRSFHEFSRIRCGGRAQSLALIFSDLEPGFKTARGEKLENTLIPFGDECDIELENSRNQDVIIQIPRSLEGEFTLETVDAPIHVSCPQGFTSITVKNRNQAIHFKSWPSDRLWFEIPSGPVSVSSLSQRFTGSATLAVTVEGNLECFLGSDLDRICLRFDGCNIHLNGYREIGFEIHDEPGCWSISRLADRD